MKNSNIQNNNNFSNTLNPNISAYSNNLTSNITSTGITSNINNLNNSNNNTNTHNNNTHNSNVAHNNNNTLNQSNHNKLIINLNNNLQNNNVASQQPDVINHSFNNNQDDVSYFLTPKIIFSKDNEHELFYNDKNNIYNIILPNNFENETKNTTETKNNDVFSLIESLQKLKLKNLKNLISFFENNDLKDSKFVLDWITLFNSEEIYGIKTSSKDDEKKKNLSNINNINNNSSYNLNMNNITKVNNSITGITGIPGIPGIPGINNINIIKKTKEVLSENNISQLKNIFTLKTVPGIIDLVKLMNENEDNKVFEQGYLKCYKSELREFVINCVTRLGDFRDDYEKQKRINKYYYNQFNNFSNSYNFTNMNITPQIAYQKLQQIGNTNSLINNDMNFNTPINNMNSISNSSELIKRSNHSLFNQMNNANMNNNTVLNNLNNLTPFQHELLLEKLAFSIFYLNLEELNFICKSVITANLLSSELVSLCVVLPKIVNFLSISDSPYYDLLIINHNRIKDDEDQVLLSFIYSFILGETNKPKVLHSFLQSKTIQTGLKLLFIFTQCSIEDLKLYLHELQEFCKENVKIRGLILFGTSNEAASLISSYIDQTDNLIVAFILSKFFVPEDNKLSFKLNNEFNELLNKQELFNLRIELNHKLYKIIENKFEEMGSDDVKQDKADINNSVLNNNEKKGKVNTAEYQLTCIFCGNRIQPQPETIRSQVLNNVSTKKEYKQVVRKIKRLIITILCIYFLLSL